ncbi:MAG: hypothetical protein SGPRY_011251 [Prymnesium sp.]
MLHIREANCAPVMMRDLRAHMTARRLARRWPASEQISPRESRQLAGEFSARDLKLRALKAGTDDQADAYRHEPYADPRFSVVASWTAAMLRRNARLRREYLYEKAQNAKESATYERKRKIKEAVELGKPVPTELRHEADRLRELNELDDVAHEKPADDVDSEYVNAGVRDPKILITSSLDPSSKLTQFLKEMKLVLPNSHRMNR